MRYALQQTILRWSSNLWTLKADLRAYVMGTLPHDASDASVVAELNAKSIESLLVVNPNAASGVGRTDGLLPTMVIGTDIEAGALVDVLPDWSPRSGIVHADFPSCRGLLPSVRSLIDHLAEEYTRIPNRIGGPGNAAGRASPKVNAA